MYDFYPFMSSLNCSCIFTGIFTR